MIYFTSDLHLGHNKDFIYKDRGFKNIEEHDLTIVKNWNKIVSEDDIVYILGDIMLNNNEKGSYYFNQLKGHKIIICGNHDSETRKELYKNLRGVEEIHDGLKLTLTTELQELYHIKEYQHIIFWLCHYPTDTGNYDDNQKPWFKRVINLFGHTHQKQSFYNDNPYMYNVGVDAHNCTPVSIEKILEDIKNKINEVEELK